MSSARSIRQLARQARCTPEEALAILRQAGMPQRVASDRIAASSLYRARLALGLEPAPTADEDLLAPSTPTHVRLPSDVSRSKSLLPRVDAGSAGLPEASELAWEQAGGLAQERGYLTPKPNAPDSPGRAVKRQRKETTKKTPARHHYKAYRLPVVGNIASQMILLSVASVRTIHDRLVEDFATGRDPIDKGERERGRTLESAVTRPRTSIGQHDKYPTIEMACAALMHALVLDHPFQDGNKRTAIVASLVFLDKNHYLFEGSDADLYRMVLRTAKHEVLEERLDPDRARPSDWDDREIEQLARWIKKLSRKMAKGAKNLKWKDLEAILRGFGCTTERRRGNKIVIRRKRYQSNVGARNHGTEMNPAVIQKVRRDLHLLEEDGVDEEVFFYGAPRIDSWINEHRKVLDDLAEYDRGR